LDPHNVIAVQQFDGSRLEALDEDTASADEFIAQRKKPVTLGDLFVLGHLILREMDGWN
jgi:hypothetical protein